MERKGRNPVETISHLILFHDTPEMARPGGVLHQSGHTGPPIQAIPLSLGRCSVRRGSQRETISSRQTTALISVTAWGARFDGRPRCARAASRVTLSAGIVYFLSSSTALDVARIVSAGRNCEYSWRGVEAVAAKTDPAHCSLLRIGGLLDWSHKVHTRHYPPVIFSGVTGLSGASSIPPLVCRFVLKAFVCGPK